MQFPQNYFQNLMTGKVTDLGDTTPAWGNAPKNLRLDYANPIEIAGVGKGWLAKNDPTMTVYSDNGQPLATLGNDMAATRKANAEQAQAEHMRLQNEKLRREINAPGPRNAPKLVDGQWVFEPSPEYPTGRAVPVEGWRGKPTAESIKQEQVQQAQGRVGELLDTLEQNYQELNKRGAMVSPTRSAMENIKARAGASGLGQLVGGAVGTEEQSIRDRIEMAKPSLINEIRAATGMSAKAMDSNAELKFYLQAATDPTKSIEANLQALQFLRQFAGQGRAPRVAIPPAMPAPQPEPQMPAGPASQQIRDNGAYIEADGKRYIVIRRNPDGSAVIRDPQTGRTGTMRQ